MTSTDLARPGDSPTILNAMKMVAVDEERRNLGMAEYASDHPVVSGYKALEEGRTLINLAASMTHAHELARQKMKRDNPHTGDTRLLTPQTPPLAVCQVDVREIVCQYDNDGELFLGTNLTRFRSRLRGEFYRVRMPAGPQWNYTGITAAPAIPPHVQQLVPEEERERFFLLWEPRWRTVRQSVPRFAFDPALLEHVQGELFAVAAAWDLTEIEQAVLAGSGPTIKRRRKHTPTANVGPF